MQGSGLCKFGGQKRGSVGFGPECMLCNVLVLDVSGFLCVQCIFRVQCVSLESVLCGRVYDEKLLFIQIPQQQQHCIQNVCLQIKKNAILIIHKSFLDLGEHCLEIKMYLFHRQSGFSGGRRRKRGELVSGKGFHPQLFPDFTRNKNHCFLLLLLLLCVHLFGSQSAFSFFW